MPAIEVQAWKSARIALLNRCAGGAELVREGSFSLTLRLRGQRRLKQFLLTPQTADVLEKHRQQWDVMRLRNELHYLKDLRHTSSVQKVLLVPESL